MRNADAELPYIKFVLFISLAMGIVIYLKNTVSEYYERCSKYFEASVSRKLGYIFFSLGITIVFSTMLYYLATLSCCSGWLENTFWVGIYISFLGIFNLFIYERTVKKLLLWIFK